MHGKLKCLLFIVCSLFYLPSYAQQSEPLLEEFKQQQQWDAKLELGNALLNNQRITAQSRAEIYAGLADTALSSGHYSDAFNYFKSLEQETSGSLLPSEHFRAIKMQGVALFYQGLFKQAITQYTRALDIAKINNQPLEQANLLNNIGLAYFNMHKLVATLDYYLKAKEIYEKVGSEQDKGDILINIAGVYIRLSRYENAMSIYQDVLKIFRKLDDNLGIAMVHNNMGVVYFESNQLDLAMHYYQLATRYYLSVNNMNKLATQYTNIANVNIILNKVELAYEQAQLAIEYSLKIDNKNLELTALQTLAKVQLVRGMLDEAKTNIERVFELLKEHSNDRIMRDGLGTHALIEASRGNYENAMQLHEKYNNELRKLRSDSIVKALAVLEKQFKATQLNQEIKELKQDRKLQELKMKQRSQLTVFIFVLLFLVIVTGVALYRRGAEKRAKQYLAEQVAQRTAELQGVAQELRAANDVKSQFLANVSHEIRTPLTAILGQTDDLMNGLYEPEQLKDELAIIQRHSNHLKSLINDVLDLSKIEANRLELNVSCFDMVQLVNDVHAMFSPQAKAKTLRLVLENKVGDEFYTRLDLMRVKQILINLCANAIKFTQSGQVVIVLNKSEQGIVFIVKDTGIGMNSSQLKLIFEYFSQADNSISRRFGGTGLGLSLSQQLASMMGGYISVQSEYKKGSQFSFFLPCAQVSSEHSDIGQIEQNKKQLSGTVLLAEDHADNRRFISRYLRSLGLDVIAVENGEQAVEQCLQIYPDLVLLDIQMPIMDGRAAFELLKKCGFQRPIFALTANAMSHEIDDYLTLGFTGYLAKPLDKDLFYKTLSENLDQVHSDGPNVSSDIDISDLVISFKQSFSLESDNITQHFLSEDFDALQKDSHRILGAAQMFALEEIASAAKNLDSALLQKGEKDMKYINQLVSELQAVLHKYNET